MRHLEHARVGPISNAEAFEAQAPDGMPGPRVAVASDARSFRVEGGPLVDLSRRPVLRAVLLALVRQHEVAPGVGVSSDALFAAAWPGQRIRTESARNRLYVALTALRRMGLRDALERSRDGYRISPRTLLETS